MKKLTIITTLLLFTGLSNAQNSEDLVAKGDRIVLGSPEGQHYQHVDFPRRNIIMKRGATANFKALFNESLIVEAVATKKDGTTKVTLKREDGINFFRFYPTVEANLEKALVKGELIMPEKKRLDSLAK
ncbi:hypothetical protein [Pareuzebyella sediminis]|uniref:hypothetical protein n=1 Tax=Pareuzebyella sediminis TaxID=2607998 RepID=UPI0011ED7F1E|nr:hypothetical protein [Pareuzebyella sediminis]